MKSPRSFRNLRLESLDKREVMAGNVTALVTPEGDFIVRGDDQSNRLHIRLESSTSNRILLESIGPGETLINGKNEPILLPPMSRDMIIDMGGGADTMYVGTDTPWQVPGNVLAELGEGRNNLSLWGLKVSGNTTLSAGSGADSLGLARTTVQGRTDVSTGDGADYFDLFDSSLEALYGDLGAGADYFRVSQSELFGLSFRTGTGHDTVKIFGEPIDAQRATTLKGWGYLSTDSGNDSVSLEANVRIESGPAGGGLQVDLGSGNDQFETKQVVVVANGGLLVDVGNGANVAQLNEIRGTGDLIAIGRDGADDIHVTNSSLGNLTIQTGNGNDDVSLANVRVRKSLFVSTEAGADNVDIDGVLVEGDAYLSGGVNPGGESDRLSTRRFSVRGRTTIRGF